MALPYYFGQWLIQQLVLPYKPWFGGWTFDKKSTFLNSSWRTDAILKMFFGYISAPYWPINAKFGSEIKNPMPIQVTWPKLQFSKTQDGGRTPTILKITLSPYFCHELSDFNQIWFTDANFHSEHGNSTKNRNFSYSRWRMDAILKIIFLAISRSLYWPISAKFRSDMKNHMQILVTWPKW